MTAGDDFSKNRSAIVGALESCAEGRPRGRSGGRFAICSNRTNVPRLSLFLTLS